MSKPFHYDYFSLKGADPEKWHSEFFWPVSHAETQQINAAFKDFHISLINRIGNTFEGDCLLIAYHISSKFIEVVNHYLAVHRLENNSYAIVPSKKLQLIPLLQKKNGSIEFSYAGLLNEIYDTKTILRNNINSFRHNFRNDRYAFFRHFPPMISTIASAGVLDREYVLSSNGWIKVITSGYLLEGNFHNPSIIPKESQAIFDGIADEFINFAVEFSSENLQIGLPENITGALHRYAKGYLLKVACAYTCLLKKTSSMKIRSYLSSTAGNPYIRALSLAVRKNGGTVTGFSHGYFTCHHSGQRLSFHELSTVNQFSAYTPGSVPLFRRNMEINPIPRGHTVSFVCDNTPLFKNLYESWKDKPLPDKIKTVMVLELSLIPEWAGYYAAEAMVNYHFYYSICKVLSENGYDVIFKKRPKSLAWEGFNLFEEIPRVRIIYDQFETPGVIDQADAIILQYGSSSTMKWAMCTNKTVIFADANWEPWFPDVYKSMEKRCRILHCGYDEQNRTVFCEKELLGLLAEKPERPDTEFMEKYLFPIK